MQVSFPNLERVHMSDEKEIMDAYLLPSEPYQSGKSGSQFAMIWISKLIPQAFRVEAQKSMGDAAKIEKSMITW